jgi:hypothetical protein
MPEQTELSDCCFSGHLHSGTPKGRETVVGGRKCYEAGEQKDKKNTIVFLQDVWGWAIPNTRSVCCELRKPSDFPVSSGYSPMNTPPMASTSICLI